MLQDLWKFQLISEDETQVQDDDAEVFEKKANDTQPSQLQNINESLSTDQPTIISSRNSSTFQNSVKRFKNKSTRIEATTRELVLIMKNNSRMRAQHLSQNQSSWKTCKHVKDKMSFLSLAKFIKNLHPIERIRVKSMIS